MRLHVSRVATSTAARAAAVFLLLAGVAGLTMQVMVARIGREFDARSSFHLTREVASIRRDITRTESKLDAAVDRVTAKLIANPTASRAAMFAMLPGEATGLRQGIRPGPAATGSPRLSIVGRNRQSLLKREHIGSLDTFL